MNNNKKEKTTTHDNDIVELNTKSRKGKYVKTDYRDKKGKKQIRYIKYEGGDIEEYKQIPRRLKNQPRTKITDYIKGKPIRNTIQFSWKDIITKERQIQIYERLFANTVKDKDIRRIMAQNIELFRNKIFITEEIYGNVDGREQLIATNNAYRKTLNELKLHHRNSGTRIGDHVTSTQIHQTIPLYYKIKNMNFIARYGSTENKSIRLTNMKFTIRIATGK